MNLFFNLPLLARQPGFTLLLALLLTGAAAQAQPGSGGPTPGGPTATPIPVDGGASLLLLGGVGYAVRRLRGPGGGRSGGTAPHEAAPVPSWRGGCLVFWGRGGSGSAGRSARQEAGG